MDGHEEEKQNWHDKYYKLLLVLPAIFFIISIISLTIFYSDNGSFFRKDISLTGGTSVTIYQKIDQNDLESYLSGKIDEVKIRQIYDIVTKEQKALIIETRSEVTIIKPILEDYLGHELNSDNSSFEFTGASLSESFFKQLMIALFFAFVLMALVVFILFRTFIPSMAVILSAFGNIVMTLATVNFLGMELSSAGIVALLLLIGYSVDTDILLTNRVLRRDEDKLNTRIFGAFKTGMTMTITALLSSIVSLIIVKSFSVILNQIFTILIIGLLFDMFNTWVTNVSLLKWYVLKKNKK